MRSLFALGHIQTFGRLIKIVFDEFRVAHQTSPNPMKGSPLVENIAEKQMFGPLMSEDFSY